LAGTDYLSGLTKRPVPLKLKVELKKKNQKEVVHFKISLMSLISPKYT